MFLFKSLKYLFLKEIIFEIVYSEIPTKKLQLFEKKTTTTTKKQEEKEDRVTIKQN